MIDSLGDFAPNFLYKYLLVGWFNTIKLYSIKFDIFGIKMIYSKQKSNRKGTPFVHMKGNVELAVQSSAICSENG